VAAITLNGLLIKPEMLMQLAEGEVVMNSRSRQLVWSEKTLGGQRRSIMAFFAFLNQRA
jgi:hypothetical protein